LGGGGGKMSAEGETRTGFSSKFQTEPGGQEKRGAHEDQERGSKN